MTEISIRVIPSTNTAPEHLLPFDAAERQDKASSDLENIM
jgi:hypothetical protein